MKRVPSAENQIAFIHSIQRILSDGQFVASYKFALLHALADLSTTHTGDEAPDGSLELPIRDIAERFIELYWLQARQYRTRRSTSEIYGRILSQNTGKQAAVLNRVSDLRDLAGSSVWRARRVSEWSKIVGRVARTVIEQPLWRLQVVGRVVVDDLYAHSGSSSAIVLRPGIAYCFRTYRDLVVDLVRGSWIRHVRNLNADLLQDVEDLPSFLFGSSRESLAAYRPILEETHKDECFYCGGRFKGSFEVDHFVPWSRSPVDLGHNFVPAHSTCNSHKSDHLASLEHLRNWRERNETFGESIASYCNERSLRHDLGVSLAIARSAYEAAEARGGLVWNAKSNFVPIGQDWATLLT